MKRAIAAAAMLLWPVQALAWIETPSLTASVASGALPPVQARVPARPSVVRFDGERRAGVHGGALNLLMASELDTRQMVVYGYARLVGYSPRYRFEPDILEAFDVQEGRIFTLRLRPGHRWSDGQQFTAEDFRYYFEDVATIEGTNDPLPIEMLVDGEAPRFEVLDPTTVRYTWSKPNAHFLAALAAPRPLYLYRPAHYLKRFHARYADPERLAEMVRDASARNWQALHYNQGQQYRNQNPALPTLDPWTLVTEPPSKRYVFRRNPYYHRIDEAGRQLPYIDEMRLSITTSKLIPIKSSAGETDLQARGLAFNNFTVLKQGEDRFGYSVHLWKTAQGARWALYPNLNTVDPEWRALLRDVRFRRALSLAVDRHEINQVIYYGLARPSGNFVLPESPLYDKALTDRWIRFDLAEANRLLDSLGLTRRDANGTRLTASGQPLEITVASSTEETEPADLLELIRDSWARIGVRLYSKPLTRELLRNGVFAGSVRMSMWSGLENGIPTPASSPHELAPTSQQQLQWPKWGQHVETRGRAGEAPDLPEAKELFAINQAWVNTASDEERERLWRRALDIYSDQVFSIGLVSGVPQVVVVNKRLRNVPAEGIFNWDPGAHFGIYRPDTFWLAPQGDS